MNIRIKQRRLYVTIPKHHIEDPDLSLAAKGLMTWLFATAEQGTDVETVAKVHHCTPGKIIEILNELVKNGYVEYDAAGNLIINDKRVAKVSPVDPVEAQKVLGHEEEKKEKLNLFEKCRNDVMSFTEDERLRKLLMDYLTMRLNPAKDSRLYNKKLSGQAQWKAMLRSLGECKGDKAAVVEQSILNSWAKFVDITTTPTASKDNISSNRYSMKEIEEIRKKVESMSSEESETKKYF